MSQDAKEFLLFIVGAAFIAFAIFVSMFFLIDLYVDRQCHSYSELTGLEIKKVNMGCYDTSGTRRL